MVFGILPESTKISPSEIYFNLYFNSSNCLFVILGETPEIKVGEKVEYNGFNPQKHETGNMRGSYLVKSDSEEFEIEFPLVFFRLKW